MTASMEPKIPSPGTPGPKGRMPGVGRIETDGAVQVGWSCRWCREPMLGAKGVVYCPECDLNVSG